MMPQGDNYFWFSVYIHNLVIEVFQSAKKFMQIYMDDAVPGGLFLLVYTHDSVAKVFVFFPKCY